MNEEITLTETGKGPIKFMGETICVVSTFEQEGPNSGRWWKVGVYTANGAPGYWVGIGHLTSWLGERHFYKRREALNLKSILGLIDRHVKNYPERDITETTEEDRNKLKTKIKEKFNERVGGKMEPQPL